MTQTPLTGTTPPYVPAADWPPRPTGAPALEMARLILDAAQEAARGVLATAQATAIEMVKAAQVVPAALATPPPNITPETIADIIERVSSQQDNYYGPNIPLDLTVDNLVDEYGNSIAPNWTPPGAEVEVEIPDPLRPASDGLKPGQPIVPGLQREDY